MALWKCPKSDCTFTVGAPDKKPTFEVPAWSTAKPGPPSCPTHFLQMLWVGNVSNGKEEQPDSVFGDTKYEQNPLYGVHVGSNNLGDIYCDFHQRKHVNGGLWPGKVPLDKPRFKNAIFHIGKPELARRLASIIPWDRVPKQSGVDIIFNCGTTEVGTEGETDIQVQAGWTGPAMTFHGYPIFRDSLRASLIAKAEQKQMSFVIDLSNL